MTYEWKPFRCDKCGEMVERIEEQATYGGPYGGRNVLLRLWYWRRWCSGQWHIRCRPTWADPWDRSRVWSYRR